MLNVTVMDRINIKMKISRHQIRNSFFTKELLLGLARAGFFIVASTSPYFLNKFLQEYFGEKLRKRAWERARRLRELQKKKLVSFHELEDGSVKIELTHQGREYVHQFKLEELIIKKPAKWDKRWRLVIYDIPHYQKKARDAFRTKLKQLGLYQLQKSIWVSAYDCLPEIEFLSAVFDVDLNRDVLYFTTTEIPREFELKRWFNLV